MDTITFGKFLFDYFYKLGIHHAFGIPGDYALPLFKCIENSKIKLMTMVHEPSVGFAADGYARVHGLGLAMVTYSVGGLNMVNSIACAYAEKSPVIVLSGAPSMEDRFFDKLVHHKVKTFDTQRRIYEEITCATTIIDSVENAIDEVERVVNAVEYHSLPGYIEIPFDMVNKQILVRKKSSKKAYSFHKEDDQSLWAILRETVSRLNEAKKPVIIADVELQRYGLINITLKIAEKFNIPIAGTILSKGMIPESHPLYIGVYCGAMSNKSCFDYVENSDCVILLGALISDIFLGMGSVSFDREKLIFVSQERAQIGLHQFENIDLADYLNAIINESIQIRLNFKNPASYHQLKKYHVEDLENPLVADDIFHVLGLHIKEDALVVADVGDAVYGSIELRTHQSKTFIADPYYASMGFAIPAAIGSSVGGKFSKVFVLVGDGAFQMTGMELSSVARYGLEMIVIVINNAGYGTQRMIIDGEFNWSRNWNYTKIPEIINYGTAFQVHTVGELDHALKEADKIKGLVLIEAIIPSESHSQSLTILGQRLSELRNPKSKEKPLGNTD